MGKDNKENILVVDGITIERASMKAVLTSKKVVNEINEASNLQEAKSQISEKQFSLIICSLIALDQEEALFLKQMIDIAGTQPVLVLGPDKNQEHIHRAMDLGARGYITKKENTDVLMEGLHRLMEGEAYFPGMNGKNGKQKTLSNKGKKPVISSREKEILRLVIGGMNNISISEQLKISVRTVENHRANMMRKLRVKNTAELVKIAITKDLVDY